LQGEKVLQRRGEVSGQRIKTDELSERDLVFQDQPGSDPEYQDLAQPVDETEGNPLNGAEHLKSKILSDRFNQPLFPLDKRKLLGVHAFDRKHSRHHLGDVRLTGGVKRHISSMVPLERVYKRQDYQNRYRNGSQCYQGQNRALHSQKNPDPEYQNGIHHYRKRYTGEDVADCRDILKPGHDLSDSSSIKKTHRQVENVVEIRKDDTQIDPVSNMRETQPA